MDKRDRCSYFTRNWNSFNSNYVLSNSNIGNNIKLLSVIAQSLEFIKNRAFVANIITNHSCLLIFFTIYYLFTIHQIQIKYCWRQTIQTLLTDVCKSTTNKIENLRTKLKFDSSQNTCVACERRNKLLNGAGFSLVSITFFMSQRLIWKMGKKWTNQIVIQHAFRFKYYQCNLPDVRFNESKI